MKGGLRKGAASRQGWTTRAEECPILDVMGAGARPPTSGAVVVSVVVPAYDEAANLARLGADVRAALEPTGLAWELLVVDDGSDDDTPGVLARLTAADPRVRSLRLPRRSGQTAALA